MAGILDALNDGVDAIFKEIKNDGDEPATFKNLLTSGTNQTTLRVEKTFGDIPLRGFVSQPNKREIDGVTIKSADLFYWIKGSELGLDFDGIDTDSHIVLRSKDWSIVDFKDPGLRGIAYKLHLRKK